MKWTVEALECEQTDGTFFLSRVSPSFWCLAFAAKGGERRFVGYYGSVTEAQRAAQWYDAERQSIAEVP